MKEKVVQNSKGTTIEETRVGVRKHGLAKEGRYLNAIGTHRDDTKVYKALLNRVSELAITKAMAANHTGEPQVLLSAGFFAPVKNMVKHVQIAGVNLTIDPSLPTFENDAFIAEKIKRANLKFSNKG